MAKAVNQGMAHRAALEGKPIELYGLKLWGIRMGQYEEWMRCKNVWITRQSAFPAFCIMKPFLDALLALDMEAMNVTGAPAGNINRILHGLALALRMDASCIQEGNLTLSIDEKTGSLRAVIVKDGDKVTEITPNKFNEIRKAVVWMQGDELPDESLNDELIQTERDLAERTAVNLKYDLLDMEASVGLAYGVRVKDVLDWSILEFETARRAIDRSKKYLVCGIGVTNGCKWDNGNPYPSWCFDRETSGTTALISQAEFNRVKSKKE